MAYLVLRVISLMLYLLEMDTTLTIGTGKPEWGAEPGKKYFVIQLGETIK